MGWVKAILQGCNNGQGRSKPRLLQRDREEEQLEYLGGKIGRDLETYWMPLNWSWQLTLEGLASEPQGKDPGDHVLNRSVLLNHLRILLKCRV